MKDPELYTFPPKPEKEPDNQKLTEFISKEVSIICYAYIEKTGNKPPQRFINNMIFMLHNAYNKKELMEHHQ